jgi:hypothetical protein
MPVGDRGGQIDLIGVLQIPGLPPRGPPTTSG